MTKGFPRMSLKQKEYCPSGYIWLTNIGIIETYSMHDFDEEDEYSHYINFIKSCREKYGDVIVTGAFDVHDRPLKHTDVAIYVLHPAIKRINKTLKILKAKRNIK